MSEIDWPEIGGSTVFCDDIRLEGNGKRLFVGVYGPTMFVLAPFPITLPSLAFNVTYFDKAGIVLPPLKLKIYFPGDDEENPSFVSEFPDGFPDENQRAAVLQAQEEGGESVRMILSVPVVMNIVEVKEAGAIKVRMQRGEDVVRLGRLNVRHPPDFVPDEAENQPASE